MRLNQYIARLTKLSRRQADDLIKAGRVKLNTRQGRLIDLVNQSDEVFIDNRLIRRVPYQTILFNKPAGFVCSRRGQGSATIYSLLPKQYRNLKTVGRLDKDSTGLILLTNDGQLANELTHPSFNKVKVYLVELDRPVSKADKLKIGQGVNLEDGLSQLKVEPLNVLNKLKISLSEGRNRQIRRTFAALGYRVIKLHRTKFGSYSLGELKPGQFRVVVPKVKYL